MRISDWSSDVCSSDLRVVIQLMPAPFSRGWIGNIRKLAAAHWWDGTSVYSVQDNYVAQWGDANGEAPAKAKPLPVGLATVPESDYERPMEDEMSGAMRDKMKAEKTAMPPGFRTKRGR